jgi:nucleoside-diphosphate-sugar epimerase
VIVSSRKCVLITGAAGRIGRSLADQLQDRYDLRLHYNQSPIENPPVTDVMQADISQFDQVLSLMHGIDAVVHMAGEPSVGAAWESVHESNIVGAYNVIEAARRSGVGKFIFASTNHVMGMYDRDAQWPIYASQPVRPDSLYGVSKAFGENLGRHYADQFGMSVINLRIGWFLPEPRDEIGLWMWLSPRDCAQVVWRAIESDRRFGTYYAISRNTRRRWDITNTIVELGYEPQDDSEPYAAAILGQ